MSGSTIKALIRLLGVGALVLGLATPAFAQAPPPAGPIEDLQASSAGKRLTGRHHAATTEDRRPIRIEARIVVIHCKHLWVLGTRKI